MHYHPITLRNVNDSEAGSDTVNTSHKNQEQQQKKAVLK